MARKKKELPVRKRIIHFRVSEDLYQVIEKAASGARLSLSEYLRELVLDRKPEVRYEVVFNDPKILQIFRSLGGCGNNLHQIARHLNQGGEINARLRTEVRECISEIYEIRDTLQNYVGEYRSRPTIDELIKSQKEESKDE